MIAWCGILRSQEIFRFVVGSEWLRTLEMVFILLIGLLMAGGKVFGSWVYRAKLSFFGGGFSMNLSLFM